MIFDESISSSFRLEFSSSKKSLDDSSKVLYEVSIIISPFIFLGFFISN